SRMSFGEPNDPGSRKIVNNLIQLTYLARKVNNKSPKQLNVKLQNRFAPLSKDPGSISDNHPSKILCFPNDMVNNLKERILQIADEYPTVTNIVLHTGSNDVSKQQSEVLKLDFTGLLNTVNSLNAAVFISGPVPPVRGGDERFSRLFTLNKWLISACADHSVHFIDNFNIFWERRHLFKVFPLTPDLPRGSVNELVNSFNANMLNVMDTIAPIKVKVISGRKLHTGEKRKKRV
uniref:SGNH hydrolase-type esterase domain-containing protein n=1 Tax=Maylandia zebra TaxID=106582 RepID=A0A3P9AZJ3_9CICH